jgi:transposase
MNEYIGLDMHTNSSVFVSLTEPGQAQTPVRVDHGDRQALQSYLPRLPKGSPVAVETTGSWYWLVDELEAAGLLPQWAPAKAAKLLMGLRNKTDRRDATGLATLLRNGTLPSVWMATAAVRDRRERTRTRRARSGLRTRLKNRILADFAQ